MTRQSITPEWSLGSWRSKPAKQQVQYDDQGELEDVLTKLRHLPPLVRPEEIDALRLQLAEVALGNKFLLQGGDCAERFKYCSSMPIENKLKVLLQMSLVLTWGARTGVVRIARMAGQYAKPRSKPTEIVNGEEINAFRGENINGFDLQDRRPDPQRLLQAYFHSAATINYVRSLLATGFADLHQAWSWSFSHVRKNEIRLEYTEIVRRLQEALEFMRTIGADPWAVEVDMGKKVGAMSNGVGGSGMPNVDKLPVNGILNTVPLYMSHEGLHLDYEECLTRPSVSSKGGETAYYNLGAHFLWIGDRTRALDGAHIEYFRGLKNPIGVKCGPSMETEELVRLLDILDPDFEIGKVTLITRYGHTKVDPLLRMHIDAVMQTRHKVVWCCDPMHGNTQVLANGVKTRNFDHILRELSKSFRIHKEAGSKLMGVHFELTGEGVTECIGGSMELSQTDLDKNYQSYCDPRLNYQQSMDIAFLIAKYFGNLRDGVMSL